jgi:site-specific recombinase XerD
MAVAANDFFDHMGTFFDYRENIYEISEQTTRSNRVDLKLFQQFVFSRQFQVIDGPAVMDFQAYLKKERENQGGSINRKIFTLRKYAQHLRLVDAPEADTLPFQDILKIRQGYRNRPKALTKGRIKRFFASIDRDTVLGIRDYGVYGLMYLTGLRVGEVYSLDLDSIDFDHQRITVTGKGNKVRELTLHDELVKILSEYIAVRSSFYQHEQSAALFLSKKGNRLAIRTMEDNLRKITKRGDFTEPFTVTCHTLRHSFASHLNDKEVDILVIQSLMGHSTPRSTENYIHPSIEKIRKAMDKLPGVIFMNELIKRGVLNLSFQGARPKRE